VFYNDGNVYKLIPNPKIKVTNATGAGDAFMAALAFCHFNNYGIDESARFSNSRDFGIKLRRNNKSE
jgi:pseudouridine kinase